jgi:hypothetical protein
VNGRWRISTYSSSGATCVEVGMGAVVRVRDTKDRARGTVELGVRAWSVFLARTIK